MLKGEDKARLKRLWESYHAKKSVEVRDLLIVEYLRLVKFCVGRLGATLPSHVNLDDLYSSGVTGLIRAVERFDPSRNSKFESYALLLIKGAIIDELRELDWIPRSVHQKANQVSLAQAQLQERLGRSPTDQELADHLGISQDAFKELLIRIRPAILVPLNADVGGDEEGATPLAEKIPDAKASTGLDIAQKKERNALLESAINALPEQEKKVLTLYYYEELMLKEIGAVMGVSESRVSQIHTKALLTLRGRIQKVLPGEK